MKKFLFVMTLIILSCMQVVDDFSSDVNYDTDNNFIEDSHGYIQIPKIGLNQKFIEKGNIDKNVVVISPSVYPNKESSLLILAAHSGTGRYAYFNYLYKLKYQDKIYITYMNKQYIYSIIDIYYQKKDGKLDIYKLKNNKTLVLITCTNGKKDLQTVYIAKMLDK